MSIDDDDRPRPKPKHEIGQELSALSVDELNDRIASLRTEVARLEAEIVKKLASRDAAANFFKS